MRVAESQCEVLDVLLRARTDREAVVDPHTQDPLPLTADQHTATLDQSLEGGDDGEVSLQVFGWETQAEAARLCLVVFSVETEHSQQVRAGGCPVVHGTWDCLLVENERDKHHRYLTSVRM